jgi:hypothetical protein
MTITMEAMKHYFVVLELPGGEELKFVNGKSSPSRFWETAASAVRIGATSIISSREDTGVCEEFRRHVITLKKFTTFVLVHLCLCPNENLSQEHLDKKLSGLSLNHHLESIIDASDTFQLVTIDA